LAVSEAFAYIGAGMYGDIATIGTGNALLIVLLIVKLVYARIVGTTRVLYLYMNQFHVTQISCL
jgi:hypothetical protein